jgi:phosphohistidine phosphatase SixA
VSDNRRPLTMEGLKFADLPFEVLEMVMGQASSGDVRALSSTSRRMRQVGERFIYSVSDLMDYTEHCTSSSPCRNVQSSSDLLAGATFKWLLEELQTLQIQIGEFGG